MKIPPIQEDNSTDAAGTSWNNTPDHTCVRRLDAIRRAEPEMLLVDVLIYGVVLFCVVMGSISAW